MGLRDVIGNIDRPVRLEGDHLVLREWTEADITSMVELFDEPSVAHRTPLPSPFTRADAQHRLKRARQGDVLLLAITIDSRTPLGEVMIAPGGHLAYIVGAKHRGQRLASRALCAAADYAVSVFVEPVLRLEIEPDNETSVAVARRAGFVRSTAAPQEMVEDKGRTYALQLWERRATALNAGLL